MEEHTSAVLSTSDQVSFIKGNCFVFHLEGHVIEFWISSFTGRERVSVDGKLVAQARTYAKVNQHYFTVAGQEAMIEIRVDSLLKGPTYCTLNTRDVAGDWQPYARKQVKFWTDLVESEEQKEDVKSNWPKRLRTIGELVLWGAFGYWLGQAFGPFTFEFWSILITVGVLFSIIKQRYSKSPESERPQEIPFATIVEVPVPNQSNTQTNSR